MDACRRADTWIVMIHSEKPYSFGSFLCRWFLLSSWNPTIPLKWVVGFNVSDGTLAGNILDANQVPLSVKINPVGFMRLQLEPLFSVLSFHLVVIGSFRSLRFLVKFCYQHVSCKNRSRYYILVLLRDTFWAFKVVRGNWQHEHKTFPRPLFRVDHLISRPLSWTMGCTVGSKQSIRVLPRQE